MAAAADIPDRWQELMNHVASNMEREATPTGDESSVVREERDALLSVAGECRAMADAAARVATAMRATRDVAPAPHEPARFEAASQASWMRDKIRMQRELATLLIAHSEESETWLARMQSAPRD